MDKKAALITGGARRVGRLMALRLAEKGYDIVIHYRSSVDAAKETQAEIEREGVACHLLRADLTIPGEADTLIERALQLVPGLRVLINSASLFTHKKLTETTREDLRKSMALHFEAPYFLIQHFAADVKKGVVINMLDCKIRDHSLDSYSAYIHGKKALADLTLMAARSLGPHIRVNGIAPGIIMAAEDDHNTDYDKLAVKNPLRMPGNPEYLLKGLEYLVDNPFVTGEILMIDGGFSL